MLLRRSAGVTTGCARNPDLHRCGIMPAGVTPRLRLFPPEVASVRRARLHVQDVAGIDATHPAALCVSELAANAVLHAATPFTVTVNHRAHFVHVEVADQASSLPATLRSAPSTFTSFTPDGRGLQIVAALATRWGIESGDEGKTIWFDVPSDA